MQTVRILLTVMLTIAGLSAQTALSGHVYDDSGLAVPGASVTVTGQDKSTRTLKSAGDGTWSVTGIRPGRYALAASAPGLGMARPEEITLGEQPQTLDLRLLLITATTRVNVQDNLTTVGTDAASNASATVLNGDDLQSLSDDPEDLQADLEALAGPSAGPGGGSTILIDGFSGGQLPAKESIREVRINQNPFSPEFDRLGLGRIEIFTKPGSDKYHGTVTYNLGTDWWNSRNPYAAQKAPFLLQETENRFSGPVTKHSSFTLDLERQAVDNGSVTNGVILDPATFVPTPFTSTLKTPQRHLRFGPHVDYQLNANNYLSLRYTLTRATIQDAGIGGFDLISRGYYRLNTFNTVQFIQTSIHGRSVNETRFQFYRFGNAQTANTQAKEIVVAGAFNDGGASSSHSRDVQASYELQNNTSIEHGRHFVRFGVRLRKQGDDSLFPFNFAGTFGFTGLLAPQLDAANRPIAGPPVQISSIEQYRRTVLGLGLALGGGPSQFTLAAGTPEIAVSQFDAAIFGGDDWRIRPNLTLNLGLRFETQTNISDRADVAPRIGFAWAPGAKGAKPGKLVIRGGFGMFYDRFGLNNTLTAQRYNGIVQQQYVVVNPTFYPNVPTPAALAGSLGANKSTQSVWEVDSKLRTPYLLQPAITVERQLPRNSTLALTYTTVHSLHVLRSQDINAPLPGTSTVYPYPGRGPVFLMTSAGLYNQNQLIANLNSKINSAVSMYATWVVNKAMSNTDGLNTFPGNPYSYAGEYGPSSTDIRNRILFGGSINTKWNVRFNPLISYQSGAPFNITSGNDPFGTTIYSARPGIAANSSQSGLIPTPYGLLDPNPVPGEAIIGRNAGRGPAQIMVNLRIQKVWSFGRERGASGATSERGGGGGGGGGVNAGGGLAPAPPSVFSNSPANRRYNISLGMSGRNIFNHTNTGPIIGNVTSPLFGHANQIAGTPNGEGFLETASNRRLEMQLRFTY